MRMIFFDTEFTGLHREIALPKGQKHNALYEAEVIKAIYEDFFCAGGKNG